VFLFVSPHKRAVGLAVVEPLKQAYKAMAPAATREQEADSQQPAAAAAAQLPAGQQQQQQQQQGKRHAPLLWPGLQRSSKRVLLERGAASAGTSLLSQPCAGGGGGGSGCAGGASGGGLRADSCPHSLLAAAGAMHVDSPCGEPASTAAEGGMQQKQRQRQQRQQQGEARAADKQTAAAAAAPGVAQSGHGSTANPGSSGALPRSLRVDTRKPVRALLGVRMVWVLPEQRRQGMATQLLDAARCVCCCRGTACVWL
jgi:hypothetical protein